MKSVTVKQRVLEHIKCNLCGCQIARACIAKHQQSNKCELIATKKNKPI